VSRGIRFISASLAPLVLTGCGPSAPKIGQAILMVGPGCWLMMSLAVIILRAVAGLGIPSSREQRLPLLLGFLATVLMGLYGYLTDVGLSGDLVMMALLMAGPSSVTLGLLCYAWLARSSAQRALERFGWPVLIFYLWLPALWLLLNGPSAMGLTKANMHLFALLWWGPLGAYGALPTLLLIGLAWRARRRSMIERAYEVDEICEVLS
jgi:hypothetical protein